MRLSDYAFVSAWENRLQTLARLAEPERWTYTCVPDASLLPILDAYLRHTFERVCAQHKLVESARYSCFNTGLVTPDQDGNHRGWRRSGTIRPTWSSIRSCTFS